jgi:hypothetical protein
MAFASIAIQQSMGYDMTKRPPFACEELTIYIKKTIESTGKCIFRRDDIGHSCCHFVYDPECNHFGRLIGFDKDMNRMYYKCDLDEWRLRL